MAAKTEAEKKATKPTGDAAAAKDPSTVTSGQPSSAKDTAAVAGAARKEALAEAKDDPSASEATRAEVDAAKRTQEPAKHAPKGETPHEAIVRIAGELQGNAINYRLSLQGRIEGKVINRGAKDELASAEDVIAAFKAFVRALHKAGANPSGGLQLDDGTPQNGAIVDVSMVDVT